MLEPAELEYADLQPIAVQPPDPQPFIEQPLAVYPEALPPPLYGGTYANSGQGEVLYSTTPGCDAGCGSSCDSVCDCLCLPTWTIRAAWEALETPQFQTIAQKGAGETKVTLTHRAHFTRDGHSITLLATHWKSGLPMFVIRDQTSGRETYAASRFLIGQDISDTEITLDFNKAHNPPCAFTDFAICPLPPRANILPFAIRAGERALG